MANQGAKGRRWDLKLFVRASLMGRMEELPLTTILSLVLEFNPSWFIPHSSDQSPDAFVGVLVSSPHSRERL